MKLYLTVGGEICAGQENDESHEDEHIEWRLRECRNTRDFRVAVWYQEQIEIDFSANVGSTVWVVYVRYGTGDSFGHTNGILGVYEHQGQAEKVKQSVYDDTYENYKFWQGYFENFESCEVESMVVQGNPLWDVVKLDR